MRIKLASVSAVLLLVFAVNVGNGYASVIDNDNQDSQDIDIVRVWNNLAGADLYDGININADSIAEGNFSLNGDNLNQGLLDNLRNLNADRNFGYNDDELADNGADLFDFDDVRASNVDADIVNQ